MLYYKANSDIKGNTNYKHLYSTNFADLPVVIAKGQIPTENELKKLFIEWAVGIPNLMSLYISI